MGQIDPNAIRVTFLGTSSGVPTRFRNVSGIALQFPQQSQIWLMDCGEATQHQLIRNDDLRSSQIRRILITHMHGDHIYGLPGLLATCGMSSPPEAIDIYGPPGLKDYLNGVLRYSETRLQYPVQIHTVETGLVFSEQGYSIYAAPLEHRVPAFGYRIVEQDRAGTFDVAKAQADGIPSGPLYGQLKAGRTITLGDGRQISGKDYVGPDQPGRKLSYCTDTIYCQNAVDLSRAADLVIHESTYAEADLPLAKRSKHSTASMAARVAAAAKARALILTHFSPRYSKEAPITLEDLQAEAQAIFPNTLLAKDRFTYEIPRRAPEPLRGSEKGLAPLA